MVDGLAAAESAPFTNTEQETLRPLREHRAFITVFVLSAMLSALVLTYIYSERYRAEATIFFKPSDVTLLNNHTTEALGSPVPSPTLRHITQTITGLVDSDVMLRRIVPHLPLHFDQPSHFSLPSHV